MVYTGTASGGPGVSGDAGDRQDSGVGRLRMAAQPKSRVRVPDRSIQLHRRDPHAFGCLHRRGWCVGACVW